MPSGERIVVCHSAAMLVIGARPRSSAKIMWAMKPPPPWPSTGLGDLSGGRPRAARWAGAAVRPVRGGGARHTPHGKERRQQREAEGQRDDRRTLVEPFECEGELQPADHEETGEEQPVQRGPREITRSGAQAALRSSRPVLLMRGRPRMRCVVWLLPAFCGAFRGVCGRTSRPGPGQSSALASARDLPATFCASVAAMKASRSPSSTPCVSEVSWLVRRSFTIW